MTRSTAKPKRNPSLTVSELRLILHALTAVDRSVRDIRNEQPRECASVCEKVANAIAYREDTKQRQQRAHNG